MLKRVGPVFAGLVVVAALVIGVPTATGHPEECANTAAWASMDGGYSPYASWQGAEESVCVSESVTSRYDDSGAKLTKANEVGTAGMRLIASRSKQGPFAPYGAFNSDLAFEDGYAYQGNYEGVTIWDVRDPSNPTLAGQIVCPGSQNDVTVNDGILVTSTDSRRTNDTCSSAATSTPTAPTTWEGLKVFDVSNPAAPRHLASVRTDCGSHTHTVLPEDDRLLVYVQSYDVSGQNYRCANTGPQSHDKISIVEIPKDDPAAAAVIATPVLFPDGGGDATTGTRRATTGCHDITVYQKIGLAAGACTGQGTILDIRNPEDPKVLANVEDPNFAFWHSATISQDGKKVLFTDELGGGSGPECNPTVGPNRGADAIYDITDPANPKFMSYFKIPRTQDNSENCVAHNGNAIPIPGRDVLVQSWYQGGTSIIDWTDGNKVKELAWFDRGPWTSAERPQGGLAGFWSTYYYNGFIYGSEIQRGLDVFKATGSEFSKADRSRTRTLNAQTQF
jgi:hypothetical protein